MLRVVAALLVYYDARGGLLFGKAEYCRVLQYTSFVLVFIIVLYTTVTPSGRAIYTGRHAPCASLYGSITKHAAVVRAVLCCVVPLSAICFVRRYATTLWTCGAATTD